MAEPVNTKKRKAVCTYEKPIDMHPTKWGETGSPSDDKKKNGPFDSTIAEAQQEMNLAKVDNDNVETRHPMMVGKDKEDVYNNINFMKMSDNRLEVVSKKKPGAGQ